MTDCRVLIVAAGRGERAGFRPDSPDRPKQYWLLAGQPVLRRSIEALRVVFPPEAIAVVIRDQDRELYRIAAGDLVRTEPVIGGAARQDSVRLGLEAIASRGAPDKILVHDAARPFVSAALIKRVIERLSEVDAVAPMLPVADTLRRGTDTGFEVVPRDNLYRTQTPQGFSFSKILAAHRKFRQGSFTDDIALAEQSGMSIAAVAGDEMNSKLTTPEDFAFAEWIASTAPADTRTGAGFDVHRFTTGDHLWLCGIRLPHSSGLEGHSDADCGLHALTDALLGAIGAGDIGSHFPPTDERWRGAASHIFLSHAASLVRELGGVIAHVDLTLICESPKIAPHRETMRQRIAEILSIELPRVSIKATTTEGLGFTGRREGLAAQALATVRLPAR